MVKKKNIINLVENNENKIFRTAIYIRVSTPERTSNWVSTSAQEKEILKYIEFHKDKYVINKEKHIYIDDWYSWASENRPELKKMIEDAKNKEFDIILVWKIDRYFRKTLFLLQYIEELTKLWIGYK